MLEVQTQEQTMGYKEAKKVKVNLVGEIWVNFDAEEIR
jgi:hypothetical protein